MKLHQRPPPRPSAEKKPYVKPQLVERGPLVNGNVPNRFPRLA